jgi:hypothetical protein
MHPARTEREMKDFVRFLGAALGCCLAVKVVADAVTPIIPFLSLVFILALIGLLVASRSRL